MRPDEPPSVDGPGRRRLDGTMSRRGFVVTAVGLAGVLAGCGGGSRDASSTATTSTPTTPAPTSAATTAAPGDDREALFAQHEVADEPNGDLSKVVWPSFVTDARAPDTKELYQFQITHGELMRYIPCFCGCGADGHRSNHDCFVRSVAADGSVELDSMAPT